MISKLILMVRQWMAPKPSENEIKLRELAIRLGCKVDDI